MSTPATYTVSADWFSDAQVTLLVDFDVLTPELATEINSFWSGAEDRLHAEDGNVQLAVVRLFGSTAIRYFMADGGASFGWGVPTLDAYWTQKVIDDQGEGWPDAEGLGILIMAAEVSVVDYDGVTLEAR